MNNKIKQLILTVLAVFLIIFGYYNYNYEYKEETVEVAARNNEETLGDVELVNSEPIEESLEVGIVPNDEIEIKENEDNYFKETKLERERMYSEMIDTYQNIISNQETPEDQKSIAAQEINNITKIKNEIMVSENLITNKGFDDVVILVNNGNINVVVKCNYLEKDDIAKIQNIIEREFDAELKNINISNK